MEVLPLGVDTETFHPDRRDPAWRREHRRERPGSPARLRGAVRSGEARRRAARHGEAVFRPRSPGSSSSSGTARSVPMLRRAAAEDSRVLVLPFERDRERLARCLGLGGYLRLRGALRDVRTLGDRSPGLRASGGRPARGSDAGSRSPFDRHPGRRNSTPAPWRKRWPRSRRDDRIAMGRTARRLVTEHNSWDRTFERLVGLYEEALRAAARSGHAG